jgi:hypothetical protein
MYRAVARVEDQILTAMMSHHQCLFLHVDHGVRDARNMGVPKYLSDISTATNCPLHYMSSQWIDNSALSTLIADLKHSVSGSKRTALLVSGSHLEDQVTVCALEALLEGFDVHLLCDIISARDAKIKPVLFLRLFQAGAVPSSLRQFLFMWLTAETDQHMAVTLRQFLENYDSTVGRRPA